jgi:hypothetical protein
MADVYRLRSALETMLETNANAHVTSVTRRALDSFDEQARKFLRIIAKAEKEIGEGFVKGSLIMLNIHGGEPAIMDLVKQSERHRALGRVQRKEAA